MPGRVWPWDMSSRGDFFLSLCCWAWLFGVARDLAVERGSESAVLIAEGAIVDSGGVRYWCGNDTKERQSMIWVLGSKTCRRGIFTPHGCRIGQREADMKLEWRWCRRDADRGQLACIALLTQVINPNRQNVVGLSDSSRWN